MKTAEGMNPVWIYQAAVDTWCVTLKAQLVTAKLYKHKFKHYPLLAQPGLGEKKTKPTQLCHILISDLKTI